LYAYIKLCGRLCHGLEKDKTRQNKITYFGRQSDTADEPILLQMYEALLNHQSFKESLDSLNHLVETLSPHSITPKKQFLI